MEGLEIHYALEAPRPDLPQQHRPDGDAPACPRPQGRAGAVSAAAADDRESRAAYFVSQNAEEETGVCVRVPAPELVRGTDPRRPARSRYRAVSLGSSRRAGALGGDGGPRLCARPW